MPRPSLSVALPLQRCILHRCRKSGASDEPMPAGQAVPFRAPDSLAVSVDLPNRGRVRGLGIRWAWWGVLCMVDDEAVTRC